MDSKNLERVVREMKGAVRDEERERRRQLSKCWGMPSGLEPPEFEDAVERQRKLKSWLELLGHPWDWKVDGKEKEVEDCR